MTFSRLVAALYGRGVTYWTKADGTLGFRAPAGALTPELRAAMREHRDDLLFLCSGGVTVYGCGQEPAEWAAAAPDAPALVGVN